MGCARSKLGCSSNRGVYDPATEPFVGRQQAGRAQVNRERSCWVQDASPALSISAYPTLLSQRRVAPHKTCNEEHKSFTSQAAELPSVSSNPMVASVGSQGLLAAPPKAISKDMSPVAAAFANCGTSQTPQANPVVTDPAFAAVDRRSDTTPCCGGSLCSLSLLWELFSAKWAGKPRAQQEQHAHRLPSRLPLSRSIMTHVEVTSCRSGTSSLGGLNTRFVGAHKAVKALTSLRQEDQLKLYAHFKQATAGPVTGKRPGVFAVAARAKWDAWSKLGFMDKEAAKRCYCVLAEKLVRQTAKK